MDGNWPSIRVSKSQFGKNFKQRITDYTEKPNYPVYNDQQQEQEHLSSSAVSPRYSKNPSLVSNLSFKRDLQTFEQYDIWNSPLDSNTYEDSQTHEMTNEYTTGSPYHERRVRSSIIPEETHSN